MHTEKMALPPDHPEGRQPRSQGQGRPRGARSLSQHSCTIRVSASNLSVSTVNPSEAPDTPDYQMQT